MRTQEFAAAVGETYNIVRNVYGRPGRAPRESGSWSQGGMAKHRQYVAADALAWRAVRDLCELGLVWDDAAPIVHREGLGDVLAEGSPGQFKGKFFAVWQVATGEIAAWRGAPSEIAEVVESDQRLGPVASVRMIALERTISGAEQIAAAAGYRFSGGEIVRGQE